MPGVAIAILANPRDRRINLPAFPKCTRSRDFLRLLLQIASKADPSGWAILSHEFSKLPHRRDRRKKSPRCVRINQKRFSLAIKFAAIGVKKIARCVAGFSYSLGSQGPVALKLNITYRPKPILCAYDVPSIEIQFASIHKVKS